MTEISELNLPDDVGYTENHEWAKRDGDLVRIGVTDYAQDQLGDIVFVEMPEVGDVFDRNEEFGTLESVKAVAEIYLPVGGEIAAANMALEETPELVNTDPNGEGWIITVTPGDPGEMDKLMDKSAYMEMLKGIE